MQHELPYAHPTTRRPAQVAPPAYARLALAYPYRLRPVILFTTFVSALYLVVVAVSDFKNAGMAGTTGALKTKEIVSGALLLGVAVIESVGFVAAILERTALARAYSTLSTVGLAMLAAGELLGIVTHFTMKQQVIDQCTVRNTGRSSDWLLGDYTRGDGSYTTEEARAFCNSQYSKSSWVLIVVLIFTLLIGAVFVSIAFGYLHQLLDPSSVRLPRHRTQTAPSAHYAGFASAPYDAPGRYAYPPNGAYAPPAGQPPGYDARGRVSDDWESDFKSPGGADYDAPRAYNARPGSSRDTYAYAEERRNSEETLKGDDVSASKRRVGDDAPRI